MSKNDSLGAVFTVAALLFGVLLLAVMFWFVGDSTETVAERKVVEPQADTPQAQPQINKPALPPGQAIVGGVQRPASDVLLNKDAAKPGAKEPPKKPHGFAPPVSPDTNEQTKLVAASLQAKDKPERYSSFVTPNDFDKAAFEADPKGYATKYANDVAPGRVFAPAQPGEGVSVLKASSARLHRVTQGESVRLSVKAAPYAPVTFSSHDLGSFENKLTTTTVVADDTGIASASFTAGGGTIDQVYVLAASPVTSGQATFTIDVSLPTVAATR